MSALGTVLAALDGKPQGFYITADTIREATQAAQLTSPEIAGALRAACRTGYLTALQETRGDKTVVMCVQTDHEPGKGRLLRLYRRTDKPIPRHVCEVAG